MFCRFCGKEVSENSVICPHCGAQLKELETRSGSNNLCILAVIGFILSFFMSVPGLICSIIGLKKCKEEKLDGKNFAVAGIAISCAVIGLSVLGFIAWIVMFAFMFYFPIAFI